MSAVRRFCVPILAVSLAAGCANLNSVYRTFRVDKKTSVSIDAKQRVVLAAPSPEFITPGKAPQGPVPVAVCAEPSPDALSAFANSVGASAQSSNSDAQKLALQGAISASESAAFVGLRTQTIQLLRDGMYRICEGYLSGALSHKDFATLQRRYQNLMMGLLAIEQLTGAVTPRPVTLNTSSGAGTGGDTQKEQDAVTAAQKTVATDNAALTKAQNDVADQTAAVKKATDTLSEKKGVLSDKQRGQNATPPTATAAEVKSASDDVKTASDDLDSARKRLSDLQVEQTLRQANVKADTDALRSAQDALTNAQLRVNANSSGTSAFAPGNNKMDPETSKEIAGQIETIVRDVISTSFIQDTCLTFMTESNGAAIGPGLFTLEQQKQAAEQSFALREACYKALAVQLSAYTTAEKAKPQ